MYFRFIVFIVRWAIKTPIEAPRGTSPKSGPTTLYSVIGSPKAWCQMGGIMSDTSVSTTPKYQVAKQSTTTLPSMDLKSLYLGFLSTD